MKVVLENRISGFPPDRAMIAADRSEENEETGTPDGALRDSK